VVDLLARLVGAQQVLAAVLDPACRAPQQAGDKGRQELLGVEAVLDAEAAADVGGDDPDRMLRYVEHVRQHTPDDVRRLCGVPHGERFAQLDPLPAGYDAARLHRLAAEAAELEGLPHDQVGLAEGLVNVADRLRE